MFVSNPEADYQIYSLREINFTAKIQEYMMVVNLILLRATATLIHVPRRLPTLNVMCRF